MKKKLILYHIHIECGINGQNVNKVLYLAKKNILNNIKLVMRFGCQALLVMVHICLLYQVILKKYFGDKALSVLIIPPSMEVLEQRLRGRGTDSEDAIKERLAKAASELDFAIGKFDIELVNDVLADTFRKAEELTDRFISL